PNPRRSSGSSQHLGLTLRRSILCVGRLNQTFLSGRGKVERIFSAFSGFGPCVAANRSQADASTSLAAQATLSANGKLLGCWAAIGNTGAGLAGSRQVACFGRRSPTSCFVVIIVPGGRHG